MVRVSNNSELKGAHFRILPKKVAIFAKNVRFLYYKEANKKRHLPLKVAPMCAKAHIIRNSVNGKIQYPVFFKNHAAVTPELVVNRLRRINTYIWLFNKSYSQQKCQFVQKTFGNTGQQQDAISKVRVNPFFRDLDQFTILLPVKDLSSVHNPYFLAMKNMIVIRSRSFFLKQKIENIVEI